MNDIRDLFPGRMRERAFQLKARRDTGVAWHEPQFVECKQCGRRATRQIWAKSLFVCPNCGNHQPIGAYYRLSLVLDSGSFRELDAELAPQDVLGFPGYPEKLSAQTQKTGLSEAAVAAVGRIGGVSVVAAVLDSRFFMGSMSTAVGEKITRAIEYAAAKKLPLVIFSASGGARMQEGIFSLMQMAKTSAAIEQWLRQQCIKAQSNEANATGAARQQNHFFAFIAIRQHTADHQANKHRAAGQRHRKPHLPGRMRHHLDLHRYRDAEQTQRHN